MHHLADLVELLEQAADILNLSARAFGNTRYTCATDYFGVLAFVGSHRRDYSFDSFESIVVDVDILDSLAHTGYHGSKVLDITHTLYLLDLLEEIVDSLNIKEDGTYVDGTLGGGGHASHVLQRLKKGRLLLAVLMFFVFIFIVGAVSTIAYVAYVLKDLPSWMIR